MGTAYPGNVRNLALEYEGCVEAPVAGFSGVAGDFKGCADLLCTGVGCPVCATFTRLGYSILDITKYRPNPRFGGSDRMISWETPGKNEQAVDFKGEVGTWRVVLGTEPAIPCS